MRREAWCLRAAPSYLRADRDARLYPRAPTQLPQITRRTLQPCLQLQIRGIPSRKSGERGQATSAANKFRVDQRSAIYLYAFQMA
jgi:hypothetical protein